MIIEGIVENLISSAIGAIILFIGGKLLNEGVALFMGVFFLTI